MGLYPIYTNRRGGRPRYFQEIVVREERTYRNGVETEVERVYVKGLRWSPKHDEVVPTRQFLKKIDGIRFALTDDLDRLLRRRL